MKGIAHLSLALHAFLAAQRRLVSLLLLLGRRVLVGCDMGAGVWVAVGDERKMDAVGGVGFRSHGFTPLLTAPVGIDS